MPHWVDREFTGHDFRDEDLSGLRSERVLFTECDFSGVDLSESVHLGSAFRNCRFVRSTLWHSTFRNCSMLGSMFEDCGMRPIVCEEVDFTLAVLAGADLRGADLSGVRTQGLRLEEADLRGALIDPSLWTTAACRGARIDVAQGSAFAAAHGLDVSGE